MGRKFAELGVDENVLQELQTNWEEKIRTSNVAQFQDPQFPFMNLNQVV